MIAINNVEIFRAGQYAAGKFTNDDIDGIIKEFDAGKEDFPITVNQIKAHNQSETRERLKNAPAIGWGKKLYRNGDTLMADLTVNSDFHELLKKRMYDKRSVGLLQSKNKLTLDHLEFLGKEWPEVKNLKSLGLSLYSQSEGEYIELQFSKEKKPKEQPMKENEITFSKAEVELEVKNATEAKEKELKIEFSKEIAGKDEEIQTLTDQKNQLTEDLKKSNDQLLEFSEAETERKEEAIKERVMKLSESGIKTPDECKGILERMIKFSKSGNDEIVEDFLSEYERMAPMIGKHGFSRGKKEEENLDEVELDVSAKHKQEVTK